MYNYSMISVSKKVEYGLAFVLYLSRKTGEIVSLRQTAEELDLPYRFLSQVATELGKAGIVESKEGKSGGYRLTDEWRERNIYDLLVALGENKRLVRCLAYDGECGREDKCKIKGVWVRAEKAFIDELKRSKLGEI